MNCSQKKDADGKFMFSDVDYVDTWNTWTAMEECVKSGLTKSIGLSNFNSQQIDRILKICTIKPVINQIECHPYLSQMKLIEFCKNRGIAYSPLGSSARPWATAKLTDQKLLEKPILFEIGKKYGKSPAQICLRWQVQRGVIVIPETVSKNRLAENCDIFNFTLDEGDLSKIASLNNNTRGFHSVWFKDHKDYPYNIEF